MKNDVLGRVCNTHMARSDLYGPSDFECRELAALASQAVDFTKTGVKVPIERIGKVDWGSRFGLATSAAVVEKLGSHALLVFNATGESAAYSLPRLELMHTHQLTAPSTM